MDRFVRDLIAMPSLPAAEEADLARRARDGDQEARSALIVAGLRSVGLRGLLLGLRGEELRDAVQAGAVGLIRAVDRFDPDKGARLATFAWWWIGSEMRQDQRIEVPLDETDAAVLERMPSDDLDLLDGLLAEEAEVLRLRFGLGDSSRFPLSRPAVADQLGLSVSAVRTLEGKAMRQVRRRLAKVLYCVPPQGGTNPQ